MPILDLVCVRDPTHRLDDEPVIGGVNYPACEQCGAEMKINWARPWPTKPADLQITFRPLRVGANRVIQTRDEWDKLQNQIHDRFPGHEINVVGESQADRTKRADEARQATYNARQARGVDTNLIDEVRDLRDRTRAEAVKTAEARNADPVAAAAAATASIPSVAELSGATSDTPSLRSKVTVEYAGPTGPAADPAADVAD